MKVALSGYGQMGQRIVAQIAQEEEEIVGVVDPLSTSVLPSFSGLTIIPDVIIDFSHPSRLNDLLQFAINQSIPLVIGTTGYTEEQLQQMESASTHIPILHTSNTSVGIQVLLDTINQIQQALPDADIELIETHHRYKEDAPSGTATMILDTLTHNDVVYGRQGSSKRSTGEIGVHAIRGGTVAGIHEVQFYLNDELITITHRAESKQVFVHGAIRAARFITTKTPGYYTMNDVIKGETQ